ncbi:type I toxin-antitoxin system Fst family toxin [Staphylococcus delphini]|uniref:type I toxin-antitoxin system Fst family toxin n=1 Tax=Staphylococcus delphini TaxID=53344 RepID=UPI0039C8E654
MFLYLQCYIIEYRLSFGCHFDIEGRCRERCEFFAHYALTVLSGCTVALFAHWLHNKDNGKKNRRL